MFTQNRTGPLATGPCARANLGTMVNPALLMSYDQSEQVCKCKSKCTLYESNIFRLQTNVAFCNDFNDFKGSSDRDERKNMNQTGRDRGETRTRARAGI